MVWQESIAQALVGSRNAQAAILNLRAVSRVGPFNHFFANDVSRADTKEPVRLFAISQESC